MLSWTALSLTPARLSAQVACFNFSDRAGTGVSPELIFYLLGCCVHLDFCFCVHLDYCCCVHFDDCCCLHLEYCCCVHLYYCCCVHLEYCCCLHLEYCCCVHLEYCCCVHLYYCCCVHLYHCCCVHLDYCCCCCLVYNPVKEFWRTWVTVAAPFVVLALPLTADPSVEKVRCRRNNPIMHTSQLHTVQGCRAAELDGSILNMFIDN